LFYWYRFSSYFHFPALAFFIEVSSAAFSSEFSCILSIFFAIFCFCFWKLFYISFHIAILFASRHAVFWYTHWADVAFRRFAKRKQHAERCWNGAVSRFFQCFCAGVARFERFDDVRYIEPPWFDIVVLYPSLLFHFHFMLWASHFAIFMPPCRRHFAFLPFFCVSAWRTPAHYRHCHILLFCRRLRFSPPMPGISLLSTLFFHFSRLRRFFADAACHFLSIIFALRRDIFFISYFLHSSDILIFFCAPIFSTAMLSEHARWRRILCHWRASDVCRRRHFLSYMFLLSCRFPRFSLLLQWYFLFFLLLCFLFRFSCYFLFLLSEHVFSFSFISPAIFVFFSVALLSFRLHIYFSFRFRFHFDFFDIFFFIFFFFFFISAAFFISSACRIRLRFHFDIFISSCAFAFTISLIFHFIFASLLLSLCCFMRRRHAADAAQLIHYCFAAPASPHAAATRAAFADADFAFAPLFHFLFSFIFSCFWATIFVYFPSFSSYLLRDFDCFFVSFSVFFVDISLFQPSLFHLPIDFLHCFRRAILIRLICFLFLLLFQLFLAFFSHFIRLLYFFAAILLTAIL